MNAENEQEHQNQTKQEFERHMVSFNPAKFKRLRKRWAQAVANKEEVFKFEGNEYLTTYAYYLLEHLKTVFKGR